MRQNTNVFGKVFPIFLGIVIMCFIANAQTPKRISYQAVVRNTNNVPLANATIGMRVSILQGSPSGNAVFSEYYNPTKTTNANGVVSIEIGSGVAIIGSFDAIDWANGPFFIKTETDPNGGSNYTVIGTSQLLSVPYAFYAEKSGTPGPVGPKGDTGEKGDKGDKGDQGEMGLKGDKGEQGLKGDQGETGLKGDKGDQGEMGLKGDKGDKGDQGDMGLKGDKGETGLKGDQGIQGEIGPKGDKGDTGLKGDKGDQGLKGEKGDPGVIPAGTVVGGTTYWDGTKWVTTSNFFYNNGNSIGINTTTPSSSAILELVSSSKGFLPPRLTVTERDAINQPAQGLIIFNTSTKCLEIWSGLSWMSFCEGGCFPLPSNANAGPDALISNTTTTSLQGNTPSIGTGVWTIQSGIGGSINNPNSPSSSFTGQTGKTYTLRWTITNACGTSSDEVNIAFGCPPGTADCNGNQVDGCEINLQNSATNCGSCGNVCVYPNASSGCSGGSCYIVSCNSGWANCDMNTTNGCETDTRTSASNCGACGNVCPSGQTCVNGSCQLVCPSGQTNCGGQCVDLQSSPSNCGACGSVCPSGQSCINGRCQLICPSGQTNCGGQCVNLQNNVNNCGACARACASVPNATVGCSNGTCVILTCNQGYANCDGIYSNGCEVYLQESSSNCGACGTVCPTRPNAYVGCVGGQCVITGCVDGWVDCDGLFSNGCEKTTANCPLK